MSDPPTPSQTVGPFFGPALPFGGGAVAAEGAEAVVIEGQVLDGHGKAVSDAMLEVFTGDHLARVKTDVEGAYRVALPAPAGGHYEVFVFARGLVRHLWTRIYLPPAGGAEGAPLSDPILERVPAERRQTLIARREGPVLRFDVRLQGESETAFFELPA